MTNINHVVLVGRLTRGLGEKDFGYTQSGVARANISIAVNKAQKKNNEWQDVVYYFDVTIWGKTAENLQPYLTKGQLVGISGYLQQDRWQDNNGQQKSRIIVVAEQVELLGGKSETKEQQPQNNGYQNNNYQGTQNNQSQNAYRQNQTYQAMPQNDFYNQPFPEDVPF